jgi:hypothetical protein
LTDTGTDTINNVYPSEQFLKYSGYTDNRNFNGNIQLSEILPYSNNAIHRNEIPYIKNIDTDDYYETEDDYVYYTKNDNDINIKVSKDLDSNNSSLKILSYNIHNWTRIIHFKNYHNIHINDTQPTKNISDIVLHGTSVITSVNPLQFSDSIPNENLQYRNIKPFMQLFDKMNADILLLQEITPQHNRYDEVTKKYLAWGAGPRASQFLVLGAKCHAAINGKYSPDIEDVKAVANAILRHRIIRNYKAEADGMSIEAIIEQLK